MPPDFGPVVIVPCRHLHDHEDRLSAPRQRTAPRVTHDPFQTPLNHPGLPAAATGGPLSYPEDIHSVITPFLDSSARLRLSLTCRSERVRFYAHTRELQVQVPVRQEHGWNRSWPSSNTLRQLLLRRLQRLSCLSIRGGMELPASLLSSSHWTHPLRELRLELGSRVPGPVSDEDSLRDIGRLLTVLGFREDRKGPLLRVLRLKGCLVDDVHVGCHTLRPFRGLTRLGLSSCHVPAEAMRGLLQMLRDNSAPRLESLELDRTPVDPTCLPQLSELLGLSSALPCLTDLTLSAALLHGERGAEVLRGLARGRRRGLKVLNLGYNDLGEVGGVALAHAILPSSNTQPSALCGLTELRLCYNFLPPPTVASLASSLHCLPRLTRLDLRGNRSHGQGMAALAESLKEGACAGLQALVLADNQLDSSDLAVLLSACRAGGCRVLRVLDLDRNASLDCHAAAMLARALEVDATAAALPAIRDRNASLDCHAAAVLARALGGGDTAAVLPAIRAVHVGAMHRIQPPALELLRHRLLALRSGAALL